MCGANVAIMDTDWHSLDAEQRQAGTAGLSTPVLIEDDVWLGINVTVLKGVTIGARTVVAAGSIVTRSLPADVIAAGQPARVVRAVGEKLPDCTLMDS
jgi:acetyltransferase-like isoleucine patch superfamily enzyme